MSEGLLDIVLNEYSSNKKDSRWIRLDSKDLE